MNTKIRIEAKALSKSCMITQFSMHSVRTSQSHTACSFDLISIQKFHHQGFLSQLIMYRQYLSHYFQRRTQQHETFQDMAVVAAVVVVVAFFFRLNVLVEFVSILTKNPPSTRLSSIAYSPSFVVIKLKEKRCLITIFQAYIKQTRN